MAGETDAGEVVRNVDEAERRSRWEQRGDKPLAQRGQGRVWRVRDRESTEGTQFALKEMRYPKSAGSTAYKRFIREVEITKKLSATHPGIVQVVDHGIPRDSDGWLPYYVMPLAESSLERAKDLEGHLEPVLKIGIKIAEALAAAHEAGVIHRDIKPGNILLFGDERQPRLCDFGICYLAAEEERLTGMDAQTVGSKGFVAPELLGGGPIEEVDARADIYSLGKTLYAATAGGKVFPREDHMAPRWDLASQFDDPRFEHLHGLLARMVTTDPAERFSTVLECKEAFERALENVRRGVPYSPGMYGGQQGSTERYVRLVRDLERLQGVRGDDAVVGAIEEGFRNARDRIQRSAKPDRYPKDVFEGDGDVAIACAEDMVATGAALILEQAEDGFEEWAAKVRSLVRPDDPGRMNREELILSDAAVLAVYLAAAYAWRKRRWSALAALLQDFSASPWNYIYLPLQTGDSVHSARWLESAIAGSQFAARLDGWIPANAGVVVGLVSGLAMLRILTLLPADQLAGLKTNSDRGLLEDFPALHPERLEWISILAQACLDSRVVERGLAEAFFETDAGAFRPLLAKVTPALRSLVVNRARSFHRGLEWRWDVDSSGVWQRLVDASPANPV